MEDEQTDSIDPKEKKKLLDDLHTWLYFLEDQNDIDMIYELTDMKTNWEEGVDWDSIEIK